MSVSSGAHNFRIVLLKGTDTCSLYPLPFPAGWDAGAMAGDKAATWDSGVEAMGGEEKRLQAWVHHRAWPFRICSPPCHKDQFRDGQVTKVAQ